MKTWFYKWLPIIFGCHQRPERSFFYKGEHFPICARCTGELIGVFIGVMGIYLWIQFPFLIWLVFMLPMIIDGFLQLITSYESNNLKRFITGLLFGMGLTVVFIHSNIYVFMLGGKIG